MFDKIRKLPIKSRKLNTKLKNEEDDLQNMPLLETTINEHLKQATMENSIKDVYKVI